MVDRLIWFDFGSWGRGWSACWSGSGLRSGSGRGFFIEGIPLAGVGICILRVVDDDLVFCRLGDGVILRAQRRGQQCGDGEES